MTMKKALVILAAALLLAGTVSAQMTSTNYATAGVIKVDGDKFMDVNDWQNVTFNNNFLFTALKGNTLSAGFASKTLFPLYVGVFFEGNTWEETPSNYLAVIAGKDNKAVKAEVSNGSVTNQDFSTPVSCDITNVGVEAGINEEKYTAHGGVAVSFGSSEVADKVTFKYSALILSAGGTMPLYKKGALSITGGADLDFTKITRKVEIEGSDSTPSTTVTTFSITPSATLAYPLNDTFTYGMICSVPVTYTSNGSDITGSGSETVTHNNVMGFEIDNGISGDLIAKKLRLNVGVTTLLPSINLDDDNDPNGTLSNEYYAGATLKMSDSVEIDSKANVLQTVDTRDNSQTSADTLWNTSLTFTVSVKF